MNQPTDSQLNRRTFLKTSSGAVLTAGALASAMTFPNVSRGQAKDDKLKIGWVGCGGRGSGAAFQALMADSNAELFAAGDAFKENMDRSINGLKAYLKDKAERVNIPQERQFVGIDAFQKVIDSGVDVVILTAPPGFRPQHIEAAVKAGKHIFTEKPMAVDGTGLRSVMASAELAKQKKLAMVDGFVWRWTLANREAYKRIHDGAIGDVLAVYSTYNSGGTDRYPNVTRENTPSEVEYQMRRWHYFQWLSGDGIVEQAIHSIDKMLWTMKDEAPVKAVAHGGRQVRTDKKFGNVFDHFAVEYRWENGVPGYHYSRQMDNTWGSVADRVFGTKGVYDGESASKVHTIRGENRWRYRPEEGTKDDGYQTEHNELFASIRSGNPINTSDRFIKATAMGIMGRMAAYTGKEVTWEQVINSKEDSFPKNLTWDSKLPEVPVALPGITPLV
ncbi:MAG: gfo/Idh/MocA family oxidoreductase [Verrucomicrobia bacterium]|jgi:predicted dehydrogenase|nr:gfo/Idh/MocA family oxidoreductase [Verrucomicrobiota bacterium]